MASRAIKTNAAQRAPRVKTIIRICTHQRQDITSRGWIGLGTRIIWCALWRCWTSVLRTIIAEPEVIQSRYHRIEGWFPIMLFVAPRKQWGIRVAGKYFAYARLEDVYFLSGMSYGFWKTGSDHDRTHIVGWWDHRTSAWSVPGKRKDTCLWRLVRLNYLYKVNGWQKVAYMWWLQILSPSAALFRWKGWYILVQWCVGCFSLGTKEKRSIFGWLTNAGNLWSYHRPT